MTVLGSFFIDGAAEYLVVRNDETGVLTLRGANTGTEYVSPVNAVRVTGRERRQAAGGRRVPVVGARAVMTLDDGTDVRTFPGVMVAA